MCFFMFKLVEQVVCGTFIGFLSAKVLIMTFVASADVVNSMKMFPFCSSPGFTVSVVTVASG